MPVFRPALIPTWRPCFARHLYSPGDHISTGAPFRLTPCPHDARASPSAHVCLAFAFRPLLRFARCSCQHDAHASPGAYVHPALMLRPVPMFARLSCSPDGHVSPNAHARPTLMLHPMLEGDRSGTYRARTLEINPPWQETCNMLDFETPDAK